MSAAAPPRPDELGGWLRLLLTPGVGSGTARRLLAAFGPPPAIFGQSPQALGQVVPAAVARALAAEPPGLPEQLARTSDWLGADPGARHVLPLGHAFYPPGLLALEDPPVLLYALGRAEQLALAAPAVAMVGSRHPTPQGLLNARQFARALAQAGWIVVSGLAAGIDAAAHQGALEGAQDMAPVPGLATIAVVGTGLDRVYPRAHQALAHAIARQGVLLSEYAIGTPPLAAHFPRRNRLIAGLSLGTLVVEAALQSGSLIT
ncbi:MAG: DNA-processing protein DprA, partial [Comamonas sp.]